MGWDRGGASSERREPGPRPRQAGLCLAALAVALGLSLLPGRTFAQDAAPVSTSAPASAPAADKGAGGPAAPLPGGGGPAKTASGPADAPQGDFECPGCLKKVAPDAARCPECGVSFKKLEYECPKCKAAVAFDTQRCANCGLAFDAPTPSRHEKRAATERSMPAVRDFLKNPQPAQEEGPEVHGSSITLWRGGKEMGRNDRAETTNRFVEDLDVNGIHLGIPELSFHSSGFLQYYDARRDVRAEGAASFQLREAYFRYESDDEKTQAQLGRQFLGTGVAREFIDGAFVHQLFGDRLGLELFGGHPVATDKSDPTGDFMGGGRIFWKGIPRVLQRTLRDLTIGVSAIEERWGWHTVKRAVGFDLSFSPSWDYDVSAHAYYDLVSKDWYDARFTFAARPVSMLQVTFDYRYLVPSLLLPKDSIFNVFSLDKRHELELDVDLQVTERLKLHALAELIYIPERPFYTSVTGTRITPGSETPVRIGAGFSYKHGQVLKGELGFETSLLLKGGIQRNNGATVYESSVLQLRTYEKLAYELALKHVLKGSLDLHLEAYDVKIYDRRNGAFGATLTGGYVYDERYSFTVGGDYRRTPDFDNAFDLFAKLEVYF